MNSLRFELVVPGSAQELSEAGAELEIRAQRLEPEQSLELKQSQKLEQSLELEPRLIFFPSSSFPSLTFT